MGHCLFMRKGETHTAPISGILASDLAVGSVVKLMEDGVATEYLVVNQGKPSGSSLYDDSCDGLWLLRKDIKEKRQWHSSNVNDYANSDIHAWLNGDFFNQFGTVEQSAIKQVKIPYRTIGGSSGTDKNGANGLQCKVFLLGNYEVGWTTSNSQYFPVDGAKLDYFDSGNTTSERNKRIAYLDGSKTHWFLRSAFTLDTTMVCIVNSGGDWSGYETNNSIGIRPALILPSNAMFDTNTLILKGVA